MEPREGRNPGKRPQKQMRTPEGWHKAWRKNSALFQNDANMIKHSPTTARSSASLRSSPLYVGLRCVASLRRSGLNFLFLRYPGFRGFAAPPPGYCMAPLRGSELGSLTLAKFPHHHPFNFRFIELLASTDKYLLLPLCENLFRL